MTRMNSSSFLTTCSANVSKGKPHSSACAWQDHLLRGWRRKKYGHFNDRETNCEKRPTRETPPTRGPDSGKSGTSSRQPSVAPAKPLWGLHFLPASLKNCGVWSIASSNQVNIPSGLILGNWMSFLPQLLRGHSPRKRTHRKALNSGWTIFLQLIGLTSSSKKPLELKSCTHSKPCAPIPPLVLTRSQ